MMHVLRLFTLLVLSMFVSACGGGHKTSAPVVENIYVQHMKDFTHVGVEAMHQERWASAEHAFERALQMAKLVNDPIRVTSAWYNLSMAYKAGKHGDKAEIALRKVLHLAKTHGFPAYESRAQLQLALLHIGQGKAMEGMRSLADNLPVDVYLMAAKLAYMQRQMEQAEKAYIQVVAMSGKNRSGLLLQAKAMMGLGLLNKEKANGLAAKGYALKVLKLCKQVGAPRLSADASLLLAGLAHEVSIQKRLDYAERAKDIYIILQDEKGAEKARNTLNKLLE
ncbi:MAG: hypothetical protein JKY80_03905 [Mariprofundaceae bacterium]|nr:hypothetical protein [Mariprofundaceae bacterium]